jgi:hypothetical protein
MKMPAGAGVSRSWRREDLLAAHWVAPRLIEIVHVGTADQATDNQVLEIISAGFAVDTRIVITI